MDNISTVHEKYYTAVYDTDRDEALRVIHTALQSELSAETLVFEVVLPSLDRMLHALSDDDNASLSQHFIAAKVAGEVVEELVLRFQKKPDSSGKVVIGTAAGDFHGLGKKIVGGCLSAHMFTVVDAGLNVSPKKFVDLAEQHGATVIGVSSMMMHTTTGEDGPRGVRKELTRRGLNGKIQLIVGGAPYHFDPLLYQKVAADAYAKEGLEAVQTIRNLTGQMVQHA